MKPFQTRAVRYALVTVALVLGYAPLASAASALPNADSTRAATTSIRTAGGLSAGVAVQIATNTDDGLTGSDDPFGDSIDDGDDSDDSDDGDLG